jgi:site-specific DNA-methyltransferase (adenine-specific)
MEANQIYHGDCMELLPLVPDASVDMVLCDLPYGTTHNKWDSVLPLDRLWVQYKRVVKPDGAIVLFAFQPFTSKLITSNLEDFRYTWVWNKKLSTNFLQAKYQPMRIHEEIVVFSKATHNYYPVMTPRDQPRINKGTKARLSSNFNSFDPEYVSVLPARYPVSILEFSNADKRARLHPTQKPVALCEYLIKTYTNPSEIVLDNCLGSGTTAIACINTGRQYIGIEKEEQYFNAALERIKQAQKACIQHTLDDMLA